MAQDSFCSRNSKISVMWAQTGVQWGGVGGNRGPTIDRRKSKLPVCWGHKIRATISNIQTTISRSRHCLWWRISCHLHQMFVLRQILLWQTSTATTHTRPTTSSSLLWLFVWKGQFTFKRKNIWGCQDLSVFGGIKMLFSACEVCFF